MPSVEKADSNTNIIQSHYTEQQKKSNQIRTCLVKGAAIMK